MIRVARVLLFLCLLQPLIAGTSVAGVQKRGATRSRSAALERAGARRAMRQVAVGRGRARIVRPLRRGARRPARPPAVQPPAAARPIASRPAGRLRRFTLWTGRVLGVRGAVQRVFEFFRPGQRVGALSASSLTVAGSRSLSAVQPALAAVSGVAGVTLAAASALELARARTHIERADAAHGVAWGLQSVGGIGGMWWNAPGWAAPVAAGLGLGGGAIQTAVGLYRLKTGLALRDRRTLILGVLDTGAGATWIASTLTGNPITLGAFFGLTGVRLLYTNGPRLQSLARRAARGLGRLVARASRQVDRVLEDRPRLARSLR